jgi:hypothetical protein
MRLGAALGLREPAAVLRGGPLHSRWAAGSLSRDQLADFAACVAVFAGAAGRTKAGLAKSRLSPSPALRSISIAPLK